MIFWGIFVLCLSIPPTLSFALTLGSLSESGGSLMTLGWLVMLLFFIITLDCIGTPILIVGCIRNKKYRNRFKQK